MTDPERDPRKVLEAFCDEQGISVTAFIKAIPVGDGSMLNRPEINVGWRVQ